MIDGRTEYGYVPDDSLIPFAADIRGARNVINADMGETPSTLGRAALEQAAVPVCTEYNVAWDDQFFCYAQLHGLDERYPCFVFAKGLTAEQARQVLTLLHGSCWLVLLRGDQNWYTWLQQAFNSAIWVDPLTRLTTPDGRRMLDRFSPYMNAVGFAKGKGVDVTAAWDLMTQTHAGGCTTVALDGVGAVCSTCSVFEQADIRLRRGTFIRVPTTWSRKGLAIIDYAVYRGNGVTVLHDYRAKTEHENTKGLLVRCANILECL